MGESCDNPREWQRLAERRHLPGLRAGETGEGSKHGAALECCVICF